VECCARLLFVPEWNANAENLLSHASMNGQLVLRLVMSFCFIHAKELYGQTRSRTEMRQ